MGETQTVATESYATEKFPENPELYFLSIGQKNKKPISLTCCGKSENFVNHILRNVINFVNRS